MHSDVNRFRSTILFFPYLHRVESLQQFLKDLESGELEPYLKSEPVPTDNSGPVTVAVAKNFEDVVTNNGKDTLIEVRTLFLELSATLRGISN